MPQQDFIYLGDNANAPYGTRSPEEVTALTQAAIERLFAEGWALVLIACNTASALALRKLQQEWLPQAAPDHRILGVFVPLIEALTGRGWRDAPGRARITSAAFFATPATVASGAFTREAKRLAPNLTIIEQGCPGLVDAIEAGGSFDAIVNEAAAKALKNATPRPRFWAAPIIPTPRQRFARRCPMQRRSYRSRRSSRRASPLISNDTRNFKAAPEASAV